MPFQSKFAKVNGLVGEKKLKPNRKLSFLRFLIKQRDSGF